MRIAWPSKHSITVERTNSGVAFLIVGWHLPVPLTAGILETSAVQIMIARMVLVCRFHQEESGKIEHLASLPSFAPASLFPRKHKAEGWLHRAGPLHCPPSTPCLGSASPETSSSKSLFHRAAETLCVPTRRTSSLWLRYGPPASTSLSFFLHSRQERGHRARRWLHRRIARATM